MANAIDSFGLPTSDQLAKLFLDFQYPEIKDLLKTFLTLIAGTLVLSISFAEKIIGLVEPDKTSRVGMGLCWSLLIGALTCCGMGLYTLFFVGQQARLALIPESTAQFTRESASLSYMFQDLSGVLFVLSLIVLAATAIRKLFLPPPPPRPHPDIE